MAKEHIDTEDSIVSIDGTPIEGIDPEAIPFPKPKRDSKPVTKLGDTVKRKGSKILDPGTASFTGIRIPGDSGQIALVTAAADGQEHTIQITVPESALVFEYQTFVSTFYEGIRDENTLDYTCELDCTGGFVRSATYAGITSIEGAGVGITYFPSTANSALGTTVENVIFHEANGITTDTIEVTAAAASYIGVSFDGGSTWTALTSGTASGIPTANYPAAGAVSKALIKVMETDKATRFVNLFLVRASA